MHPFSLRRAAPAVLLALGWGCSTPGGPPIDQVAEEINATLGGLDVTLAPGDLLEIRFAYAPDWNQEVEIRADGTVAFVAVDEMQVAGLRPTQLDERLTAAYESVLDNPDLSVVIRARAPRSVTVMGEVSQPGEVLLTTGGRMTLVEAIGRVGGHLKETAHLGSTVLVRWDSQNQRQLAWTIDARPEHWTGQQTVFLQPYDVVFVPNTNVDKVGIWVDMYIRRMIPFPRIFVQ